MTPNRSSYSSRSTPFTFQRQQSVQSVTSPAPTEKLLDNKDIFRCTSAENLANAVVLAQYSIDIIADVWLGLNEWEMNDSSHSGTPGSILQYTKPPVLAKIRASNCFRYIPNRIPIK